MRPELVIFDCNGVLIDSEVIAAEIEAEALCAVGYEVSADGVIDRFLGRPAADAYKMVEAALGHPLPEAFGAAIDAKITAAYRSRLLLIPGIFDLLGRLTVSCCVASSSAPAKLVSGLLETGLLDHFYPHIFSTVLVEKGSRRLTFSSLRPLNAVQTQRRPSWWRTARQASKRDGGWA